MPLGRLKCQRDAVTVQCVLIYIDLLVELSELWGYLYFHSVVLAMSKTMEFLVSTFPCSLSSLTCALVAYSGVYYHFVDLFVFQNVSLRYSTHLETFHYSFPV